MATTLAQIHFVLLGISLIQGSKSSYMLPVITVLEDQPVHTVFRLPDTPKVTDTPVSTIAIDHQDNSDRTDVMWIYTRTLEFKLQVAFQSRLMVLRTMPWGTFHLSFKAASADMAGTFGCYVGTGSVKIPDCGLMLIVLRKPPKPIIAAFRSSESSDLLQLQCIGEHVSLPAINFGSDIEWLYSLGTKINSTRGAFLVLDNSRREYNGINFICRVADMWEIKGPFSDPSDMFQVVEAVVETDIYKLEALSNPELLKTKE